MMGIGEDCSANLTVVEEKTMLSPLTRAYRVH